MASCPACGEHIEESGRSGAVPVAGGNCPFCGEALESGGGGEGGSGGEGDLTRSTLDLDRTVDLGLSSGANGTGGGSGNGSGGASSLTGDSSILLEGERFAPGSVLAGRYRMVGLLGKGGMGEVYRADDIKLGQPVALKFLSRRLAHDPRSLARLYGEVRMARQVAHANVCRVYDVAEFDGQTLISMEYVDGEDLTTLLKRIGRFPQDKAGHIAQQICAGLAAAHERGILHRDLKPANVMLDGRGAIRIADFGLAGWAAELQRDMVRAGTPAYMAPEQFKDGVSTVQTDLYSLGLVLFEIYTGKPAYKPGSLDELRRLHAAPPPNPINLVPDLDPRVERAILWCLEADPANRPASVKQLAATLPGGNALMAALMAGETPSPSQVAAAGEHRPISGARAATVLVLAIVAIALAVIASQSASLLPKVGLTKSGDVLADKARELLTSLGVPSDTPHRAWGFEYDEALMEAVKQRDSGTPRWIADERPNPMQFWYRQSPTALVPNNPRGRVSMSDPRTFDPGDVRMRMNPAGQLRELTIGTTAEFFGAVPAAGILMADESAPKNDAAVAWLFEAAQLDPSMFQSVTPEQIPPVYGDSRLAWRSAPTAMIDGPIRIEAVFLAGRPVWFRVFDVNWTALEAEPVTAGGAMREASNTIASGVWLVSMAGAVGLAWRNLRHRRGDRTGALRVAVAMGTLLVAALVTRANHAAELRAESQILMQIATQGLMVGLWFWVFYIAIEPYVRRQWPETIISWARLLEGRWRDPLVGYNITVGVAVGAIVTALVLLDRLIPGWMGWPAAIPWFDSPLAADNLDRGWAVTGTLAEAAVYATQFSMAFLMALILLKLIFRERWLVIAVYGGLQTVIWAAAAYQSPVSWFTFAVATGITTLLLVRLGLLALIAGAFTFVVLGSFPISFGLTDWYAPVGILALVAVLALAIFGTVTAAGAGRNPELAGG